MIKQPLSIGTCMARSLGSHLFFQYFESSCWLLADGRQLDARFELIHLGFGTAYTRDYHHFILLHLLYLCLAFSTINRSPAPRCQTHNIHVSRPPIEPSDHAPLINIFPVPDLAFGPHRRPRFRNARGLFPRHPSHAEIPHYNRRWVRRTCMFPARSSRRGPLSPPQKNKTGMQISTPQGSDINYLRGTT
jgi:hypothetical protein